jgi:DNA-binding MarR family transcriptional regulator
MAPCYCVILRRAARKTTAIYDDALASTGINIAQFSLLRRIARARCISLTELAREADLDRSTIGRNTKVLAKMGLIETKCGEDHREAPIGLTDTGQRLLQRATPLWQTAQDEIEALFGGEPGARQLQSLLNAL